MAEDVVAEIVASVLEVRATPGQQIEIGDTLVLLESMKMEIPLLAPCDGIIQQVHVQPGSAVRAARSEATAAAALRPSAGSSTTGDHIHLLANEPP